MTLTDLDVLFSVTEPGAAVLSPDGHYRYGLMRSWGFPGLPRSWCHFVMLNPSTADARLDDPTIRRCAGYSKAWGYDGLVVTNLFALRATDPKSLYRVADPIGPGNDDTVIDVARRSAMTVCGWGAHGTWKDRGMSMLRKFRDHGIVPHALKLTGSGQPCHPLYLPGDLHPVLLGVDMVAGNREF
jgi:hypothetical protein